MDRLVVVELRKIFQIKSKIKLGQKVKIPAYFAEQKQLVSQGQHALKLITLYRNREVEIIPLKTLKIFVEHVIDKRERRLQMNLLIGK